jgi:hypothetical protein
MALRIIDLDIDESLSADTRVSEIGWVFQPAIETEFVYFSKDRMDKKSLKKVQDYLLDYQPSSLPTYVNYATGNTKDDMLIKPVLFVEKQSGESVDEYISRCVAHHIKNEGMEADQAYAICKSASESFNDCPCLNEKTNIEQEIFNIMQKYNLVGFIDGQPVFSTPDEAEIYGEILGCNGHHKHTDEDGNEVYMACETHPEKVQDEMSFESYNDYPKEASNNACRAVKWAQENGWGDCLQAEGKQRANQLCNREKISEETIARMSSFRRHQQHKDVPYSEGCGGIAWDAWGGDAGVDWAERKLKQIRKEEMSYGFGIDEYTEEEIETIKLLKFLAETDYEKFEAVVGSMRGATESEIYKRNHKTPTVYFQYERVLSGSPDRDFCTSIENRYFRRLEIDLLRDTNTEFGHEQKPYSKYLYKGGPNCVHAWHKYLFQGKNKVNQGMAEGRAGIPPKSMPNNGYFSPETKRKSEVAYIVSQQNMSKQVFKADVEQRMLYTPLMLPNILIPRNDNGDIYFVRFRPDVIEKIRNKFMIEGRLRQNNYEHSEQKFNDMVMVESWIVNGPSDKAYELGFTQEQVPIGSWMGGYKILDTEEGDMIWNDYIKSGKIKGASVEGEFLLRFYKQDFNKEDILLEKIFNILSQVK